jgi:hypothetical protein
MSFQVSIEELPLSTYLTGPERDLLSPFSRLDNSFLSDDNVALPDD